MRLLFAGVEHHLPLMANICVIIMGVFDLDYAIRPLVLHGVIAIFGCLRRAIGNPAVYLWYESKR